METDQTLSAQFCFSIYSTLIGINRVYRNLLTDLGLTYPQYLVMLIPWEKERLSISDICDQLYLETTTVTPLLKRLEDKKIIIRERDREDQRKVIVSLTPAGHELKTKSRHLPGCISEKTGRRQAELQQIGAQLKDIRDKLFTLT